MTALLPSDMNMTGLTYYWAGVADTFLASVLYPQDNQAPSSTESLAEKIANALQRGARFSFSAAYTRTISTPFSAAGTCLLSLRSNSLSPLEGFSLIAMNEIFSLTASRLLYRACPERITNSTAFKLHSLVLSSLAGLAASVAMQNSMGSDISLVDGVQHTTSSAMLGSVLINLASCAFKS